MQIEELRKMFGYLPDTGAIIALRPFGKGASVPAGTRRDYVRGDGYMGLWHAGKSYLAHRVIWALVTGNWPKNEIDHINGLKNDNRWINLRHVTRSENMQNQARPAASKKRTSQFLGVSMPKATQENPKPWAANIKINGVNQNLGYFADEWEAAVAYLKAKDNIHPTHSRLKK